MDDERYSKFLLDGELAPSSIGILEKEGIRSFAAFRKLRAKNFNQLYQRHKIITLSQLTCLHTLLETAKRSVQSQCPKPQQQGICCLLQLPISYTVFPIEKTSKSAGKTKRRPHQRAAVRQ